MNFNIDIIYYDNIMYINIYSIILFLYINIIQEN